MREKGGDERKGHTWRRKGKGEKGEWEKGEINKREKGEGKGGEGRQNEGRRRHPLFTIHPHIWK